MPKVYVVNTNKTHNQQNEIEMIKEEKVAAYYSPWKYYINEIEANDIVFLYSNSKGIIARGLATGIVEVKDVGRDKKEEHYMNLNRFGVFKKALPSSEIITIAKSLTDTNYTIKWNQTMIHIPYFIGLELWQFSSRECF